MKEDLKKTVYCGNTNGKVWNTYGLRAAIDHPNQIMKEYTLKWPDNFDGYSWEVECKGWFAGLEIVVGGKTLRPMFYDPTRLSQDIAGEISSAGIPLI